ncbi:hypothetical protein ACIBM4_23710 [Streptomyces sp. NPDC050256]|uniref:hypothetical protein n=1 Tax=Streptomyces sp. NPDC050256 TaxID=3365607 RepID=UPI0037BD6B3D
MSSKLESAGRAQARVRDRFGAVLTASMSVLFVETVIGWIALFMWGQVQENPGLAYNALGLLLLIVLVPVGAVVGALVSVGVVMPLLTVAGWLGRRLSGREAWWWVPALTAVGAALLFLAVGVEADPWAGAVGWLLLAMTLTPAALTARRLLLPDRRHLTGAAMFGRVAMYGTLAVIATCTLCGIALAAGIGYEPPRLNTEQAAGTWSDGKAARLSLTADGHATAIRVDTFDLDDSFETVRHPCTGAGTWEYDPGAGPQTQTVTVSIDACPMDAWSVLGTPERPKLYVFIGDPDSGDLYILRRED